MNKETFAQMVVSDDNAEVFVDPATIAMTIKIVSSLISVIKRCKQSSEQVKYKTNNPSATDRRALRRIIIKHMGVRGYLKNGQNLTERILKQGKSLNDDEIDGLLGSSNTLL